MVAERQEHWTPSDEDLERYTFDTAAMLQELCCTTNPATGEVGPIELLPHQIEALHDADARDNNGDLLNYLTCFCWAKGDGKSLLVAGLLLNRLLFWSGTENYILANTERQGADVLFREVARIIRHSPRIREYWNPEVLKTAIQIMRTSDEGEALWSTSIEVLPCSMAAAEGKWITPNSVIASDEAHRAIDPEPFSYLKSQAGAKNALMAVSSQAGPPVADNPIYGVKCASENPDPEVSAGVLFLYHDAPRTPWGIQQAARDKGTDPASRWRLKWRNEWKSKGVRFLDGEQVDVCARDYEPPENWADVARLLDSLGTHAAVTGGGLDRSMSYVRLTVGDRTVWATVVRTAERPWRIVVVQFDVLGEAYDQYELAAMDEQTRSQLAKNEVLQAAAFARMLGATTHMLEAYQAQDLLGEIPGSTIRHMTTPRKVVLYETFGQLVRQGRIIWSSAWELLTAEAKSLTVDDTGATPRYEGKPHDDGVDGVLNALDAVLPDESDADFRGVSAQDVVVSSKRYEAAYG